MSDRGIFRGSRRGPWIGLAVGLVLGVVISLVQPLWAQKAQETYKDKFEIAGEGGGVAVATSSDGKYVYVAGRNGVIVSGDFGKTGTWVQTVRMK